MNSKYGYILYNQLSGEVIVSRKYADRITATKNALQERKKQLRDYRVYDRNVSIKDFQLKITKEQ